MEDLKKAFTAARAYKEHTTLEAARELEVSESFLHKFLKGEATSAPLRKKIRTYIYEAGVVDSITKLGLDPHSKPKLTANQQ